MEFLGMRSERFMGITRQTKEAIDAMLLILGNFILCVANNPFFGAYPCPAAQGGL
jgi:hypothetical protein